MATQRIKRIGFFGEKGGPGKSHTCYWMGQALTSRGRKIRYADWDINGTLTEYLTDTYGEHIPSYSEEEADYEFLDTPGSISHPAWASAAVRADLGLVISSPTKADLRKVKKTVDDILERNPNLPLFLVVNKRRIGTKYASELNKNLTKFHVSIPCLDTMMSLRESYAYDAGNGWKALDIECRMEVTRLALNVTAKEPRIFAPNSKPNNKK